MSYQELPYTYGKKTLKQINDMTGMVEGDTVFNTTWGLIEIYSGTMWTNSQMIETIFIQRSTTGSTNGRLTAMPPIPQYASTYPRVQLQPIQGTNNDEQNGYVVMQAADSSFVTPTSTEIRNAAGYQILAVASTDQDRIFGVTVRGVDDNEESVARIGVAFMGNWNGYVTPNTNSGDSNLEAVQGCFCKISSSTTQAGMLDDSFPDAINSGNFGPLVNGRRLPLFPSSASTAPDRNIEFQIHHMEVA
tara:strand:+ start:5384 stop:6124 length:741 start_codon:yes stop_codon:yes gene_type:complete